MTTAPLDTVLPPETVLATLEDAARAPSAHNAQPWRVHLDGDRMAIRGDAARRLPAVDPDGREQLLSLGAFVEALVVALHGVGADVHVEVPARPDPEGLVAVVHVTGLCPPVTEAVGALHARATDRLTRSTDPLPTGAVEALLGEDPGHVRWVPRQSHLGAWLADATVNATSRQHGDLRKTEELARWLRLDPHDVTRRRDGLTAHVLGLSTLTRIAGRFLPAGLLLASRAGRRDATATARAQVDGCAGFVLVSSADRSPSALLAAGRLLQRVWLQADANGVALHPMSQTLEESPWRDRLDDALGAPHPVQLVLRAVRRGREPPVSPRRPAAAFVARRPTA